MAIEALEEAAWIVEAAMMKVLVDEGAHICIEGRRNSRI